MRFAWTYDYYAKDVIFLSQFTIPKMWFSFIQESVRTSSLLGKIAFVADGETHRESWLLYRAVTSVLTFRWTFSSCTIPCFLFFCIDNPNYSTTRHGITPFCSLLGSAASNHTKACSHSVGCVVGPGRVNSHALNPIHGSHWWHKEPDLSQYLVLLSRSRKWRMEAFRPLCSPCWNSTSRDRTHKPNKPIHSLSEYSDQ